MKTQKFYDLEVKNDHFIEDYKENFAAGYNYEYDRLLRRISRIIKSEFGRRVTLSQVGQIKREVQDEIQQFVERLVNLSESELSEFQELFHESLSEIHNIVDPGITPPAFQPVRGFMNKNHPIERGKVISIQSMILSTAAVLYQDISNIVSRMNILEEDVAVLGNYYESATQKTRNNISAIGVTAVALSLGFVRDNYFRRAGDIIGHQHISVLDSATTEVCQFRHSKVWYYDDKMSHLSTLPDSVTPPLHHRCRSEAIPLFRGDDILPEETYQQWFERQDNVTKREILGKERYQLYNEGTLKLSQFTDRQGSRIKLDELRSRIIRT